MSTPITDSRARVLVIDDEPLMRKLLTRLLQRRGYDVLTAGEGGPPETREKIVQGGYDIIITDLHMPRLDGLGVLKLAREVDSDMPVILVTAAPSTQTAIDAVNLRATAYLTKPIEGASLDTEVQSALALSRLSRVRKEAHSLLGKTKEKPKSVELDDLDLALAKLHMVYQPIVTWRGRKVHGYEALVRSQHPPLARPDALFAAAERHGRSEELSRAIRRHAIVPTLPDGTLLFLNLHADDLLDETLFEPESPLAQMAERVVLEITERAQLEQVSKIGRRIEALRSLGFCIAVDDIGAGYSGLSSFALLKPDIVKLDLSLVRDLHLDPVKQRLARMVIQLCNDLGIDVVGEGVENAEERDALLSLGCDLLQGYFFGRPGDPFPTPTF